MHPSVNNVFPAFSKRFEGYVHWMYLDIKGLVTIGIGNLIDTEGTVKNLPFTDKVTGARATQTEIIAEWKRIKGMHELAQKGYKACEAQTRLRVSDAAIAALVRERLRGNEELLRKPAACSSRMPSRSRDRGSNRHGSTIRRRFLPPSRPTASPEPTTLLGFLRARRALGHFSLDGGV